VGCGGILPLASDAEVGQSHTVNALKRKIIDLIQAQGPITVAQYMAIALGHPEHGYYMRRDPLGRDFITAPEVSQIFGELIGLFFVQAWEDRGKPDRFHLVELGPGRGTLMADMMRAVGKLRPAFVQAAKVVLVETSPALRSVQANNLASLPVQWTSGFQDVSEGWPLFVIANEFFDALPIRQFVKAEHGWHERMVTSDGANLRFLLAPDPMPLSIIPERLSKAPPGAVFEANAGATSLVSSIATRIADAGGLALIIDYGHTRTATGETLQAMRHNAFVDPLEEPGDADLTSHVDFAALGMAARQAEAYVTTVIPQGQFLDALGIRARAHRLKNDNPERTDEIDSAVDRLTNPQQMGTIFRVLAIYNRRNQAAPPGFHV
jgi:NADH dehydrogenase [ubiquinone] 1 alpha subcomplex assembly factor 7